MYSRAWSIQKFLRSIFWLLGYGVAAAPDRALFPENVFESAFLKQPWLLPSEDAASPQIDLTTALARSIYDSYPGRIDAENLRQARARTAQALGMLLPRVSLSVTAHPVPLKLDNFVNNLLAPVLPISWLNWLHAKQFYDARRSELLDLLIQRRTTMKILYYEIHRARSYRAVLSEMKKGVHHLLETLAELTRTLPPEIMSVEDDNIDLLTGFSQNLDLALYQVEAEVLRSEPQLAQEFMSVGPQDHPRIARLDLFNLDDHPFVATDQVVRTAVQSSYNILMWDFLVQAARTTYYGSFAETISPGAKLGNSARTLGLSFGLDTVANIKITRSELEQVELEASRARGHTEAAARSASESYNLALQAYRNWTRAGMGLNLLEQIVREKLRRSSETGHFKLDVDLLENLLAAQAGLIDVVHDFWLSLALLEQVMPEQELDQLLRFHPVQVSLRELLEWAREHRTEPRLRDAETSWWRRLRKAR